MAECCPEDVLATALFFPTRERLGSDVLIGRGQHETAELGVWRSPSACALLRGSTSSTRVSHRAEAVEIGLARRQDRSDRLQLVARNSIHAESHPGNGRRIIHGGRRVIHQVHESGEYMREESEMSGRGAARGMFVTEQPAGSPTKSQKHFASDFRAPTKPIILGASVLSCHVSRGVTTSSAKASPTYGQHSVCCE